jgi:hypothetical protein
VTGAVKRNQFVVCDGPDDLEPVFWKEQQVDHRLNTALHRAKLGQPG